MIAIKDMEMPKSCNECPFKANDYVCRLLDCAFSCNHFKERNYNCPLVEIVTCKDCEHCKKDMVEGIEYLWCNKDSCATSEHYYCGGGRRKL